MSTFALVGAASFDTRAFAARRFDAVIAVDGGYASLGEAGIVPDYVVGDFDSLGFVPAGAQVHPSEKDESDLELASAHALREGADKLVLFGCLGGRIDHTLANLALLVGLARRGVRAWAVGESCAITALAGGTATDALSLDAVSHDSLCGPYGPFLSVFPYGGVARGVTLRGLKYPLEDAEMADDVSRGLSNEFTGATASIAVREGVLVVTFPVEAWLLGV